ncbi:MAG: DegT/DnrJ/EryC1/StrS family aminotransferase [Gemmatimonadaceae bacterium]|nr:DegT/DnrJ/EryC1/StrS family aminotransferase [Gloeobacterales cyanobacterium ES-bin-141]
MIPILDLKAQYQALAGPLQEAVQEAMASGHYILGPRVRELEAQIASYCGTTHAIGLNSGTDALYLALRALGIGPGDEVITTPFTFIATTEAIGAVGATPVFVDINPLTFNLDVTQVENKITARTRALLPVHLYGQPCDMEPLMEIARHHSLRVIEDCAQAIGATYRGKRVGTFGDVGCFSFFPSKNLGCFGDGGMAVTSDAEIAGRIEMLRRHGGKRKYHHTELGVNSRLDELQAAILLVKLPHLDAWNAARRTCADYYNRLLDRVPGVVRPHEAAETGCVYHQYTIRVRDRDRVQAALKEADVASMVYYPVPLHLQPVHHSLAHSMGDFPVAEQMANEVLSLPMFPELSPEQQRTVIGALQVASQSLAVSRS